MAVNVLELLLVVTVANPAMGPPLPSNMVDSKEDMVLHHPQAMVASNNHNTEVSKDMVSKEDSRDMANREVSKDTDSTLPSKATDSREDSKDMVSREVMASREDSKVTDSKEDNKVMEEALRLPLRRATDHGGLIRSRCDE